MRPIVIVLNENSSEIYFPAMLKFRRHNVVTAMINITISMIRQRTLVGAAPADGPGACTACGGRVLELLKRFFGPVVRLVAHLGTSEIRERVRRKAEPPRLGLPQANPPITR